VGKGDGVEYEMGCREREKGEGGKLSETKNVSVKRKKRREELGKRRERRSGKEKQSRKKRVRNEKV
jgi:hypothetical protein